jgi:hypothetical protein
MTVLCLLQTPLTYQGVSTEPTKLEGPSCKYTFKFGPETTITVAGSNSPKVRYATEKDFYSAAALNQTFDFYTQDIK